MSDRWIVNPTGNVDQIQGCWRYEVEWNDGDISWVEEDDDDLMEWFERCVDHE